jgi:hypothetical protein
MFLLFLCPGTILAPSCRASCQASSSPPPSSGSVGAASSHPFSHSTTAPLRPALRTRSFTIRVGSRDEVIAVSRLKACTAADTTPGSPRRCGRPPGSHPGDPAATKWVSFSDPLVSSPSLRRRHQTVPELFSYPVRRFLHARDWRHHHRCHRRGTRPVNGHRHRDWTSDLFFSRLRPELGGSPPCRQLPTPLETVRPVGCTPITLYCTCI